MGLCGKGWVLSSTEKAKWFVLMQIVCAYANYTQLPINTGQSRPAPTKHHVVNRQKIRLKWCVKSWKWISMPHLSTITPAFTRVILGGFSPPLPRFLQIFLKADWKHSRYYPLSSEKKELRISQHKRDFLSRWKTAEDNMESHSVFDCYWWCWGFSLA